MPYFPEKENRKGGSDLIMAKTALHGNLHSGGRENCVGG